MRRTASNSCSAWSPVGAGTTTGPKNPRPSSATTGLPAGSPTTARDASSSAPPPTSGHSSPAGAPPRRATRLWAAAPRPGLGRPRLGDRRGDRRVVARLALLVPAGAEGGVEARDGVAPALGLRGGERAECPAALADALPVLLG